MFIDHGSSEEIVEGMSEGVPASLEYVDAVPAVIDMSQRGGVRVNYQDWLLVHLQKGYYRSLFSLKMAMLTKIYKILVEINPRSTKWAIKNDKAWRN